MGVGCLGHAPRAENAIGDSALGDDLVRHQLQEVRPVGFLSPGPDPRHL